MILALVAGALASDPTVTRWLRLPDADARARARAAGWSFAEGTDGDWVRMIGPAGAEVGFETRPEPASAEPGYLPTPEAVLAELDALAATGLARRVDLGVSGEGRPIVGLRIGEGDRVLRVLGGHHGDEGSSVVVALAVARSLVEAPLPDAEVWVVPVVNPDGLAAAERHSAAGVDLNRNYEYRWDAETPFSGPAPFSEPETRAVRALTRARAFAGGLSLHSGAANLGWPWNWTTDPRAPDEPLLVDVADAYADACGVPDFWVTNGADWYVTEGDTTDWTYGRWGQLDYTLELTTEKSPPASMVDTYVADHLDAIRGLLATPVGLSFVATDARTGEPIPAWVEGPDLAPTWTGPDGRLARWYQGDPSALVLHAPGYAPGPLGAPLVPDQLLDTLPSPRLLSRGAGPSVVVVPGLGEGELVLSQPGEPDLHLQATAPDTWVVDPSLLAAGAWTLSGPGGVIPRGLFVGEATDRVAIDHVRVDGRVVVLGGSGFGEGTEAWGIGGPARALHPLRPLGETPDVVAFAWDPADTDLLLWSNGAWLAAVGLADGGVVDLEAPSDTGAPPADGPELKKSKDIGCAAVQPESMLSTMIVLVFLGSRKKVST